MSELGAQEHQERSPIAVTTTNQRDESSRADQTPAGGDISSLERRRLELETGPGGDHDVPYSFSLPPSLPQVLAWMRLLAKVHRGELDL